MILRATHTTTYIYSAPVSICHTEVHLAPRATAAELLSHNVAVVPEPDLSAAARTTSATRPSTSPSTNPTTPVHHRASLVDLRGCRTNPSALTPPWEQVREAMRRHRQRRSLRRAAVRVRIPAHQVGPEFAPTPAILSRRAGPCSKRHWICASASIAEFEYDPRATTVTTPVDEVLTRGRASARISPIS